MEWVEITARTVREATDKALDALGVDEADAEVRILEEPQPGFFGRTRGVARVQARVAPRPQPPKQERRDRRRKGRSGGQGDQQAATAAPADSSPGGSEGDERSGADDGNRSNRSDGRGRSRRGGRGGRGSSPRSEGARDRDSGRNAQQGDTVEATFTLDEHVAEVERFVGGLVDAFGADATIEVVEVDEETREVRVVGDDLGLLIGPRGLTLQAIHDLARTVVFRAAPGGQDGRVRIDIGGYRERRREALASFATKIGQEVAESGEAKSLEPMSPPDRKVVHDTINTLEGVHTTSEGAEPRRRVVVLPD